MKQDDRSYIAHCEECSDSMVIQAGGEAFRCPCWDKRGPMSRGPKCRRCDDFLVLQDEAEGGSVIESPCLCHVL